MKKKVLVLGSTGMIGHQVHRQLEHSNKYDLHNFSFRKPLNKRSLILDVINEQDYFKKIKDLKPDIIINCIGILIEGCNSDLLRAIQINSLLPHKLANLAEEIDFQLIHMSTDCVFSGRKEEPYVEDDEKDGLDFYAKTKGLGEVVSEKHLTIRTSVIGPELKEDGRELFNWFMSQKGEIDGYSKGFWSGVSSLELARAVEWFIDHETKGLYHVTNGKPISKYDLLCLMKEHTKRKIFINPVSDYRTNKGFIDSRQEIDFKIPTYDEMIFNMIELIRKEKNLYVHYANL